MGLYAGLRVMIITYLAIAHFTVPSVALEGFTLDDVLSGRFSAQSFNGTWISDTEFSYRTSQGGINIYNLATSTAMEMISSTLVSQLRMDSSYMFSPDRRFVLYNFDGRQLYRHSNVYRYSVLDLVTSTVSRLQPTTSNPQLYLRYATWNKVSNNIFYVYENNIYYRSTPNVETSDLRVTTTGEREAVFNGIPDWVYEEEVLSDDNAMWIAQNGQRMVYATFDDRQVEYFDYTVYGDPSSLAFQYPNTTSIRYPKAGRTNPSISLTAVSGINTGTLTLLPLTKPADIINIDHYFTMVAWATNDEVMISWLNRQQNVCQLSFCDITKGGICQTEYTITETTGWVDDSLAPPKFSTNGRQFLIILPQDQSGGVGKFKHLVLYNRDTKALRALSSGRWEVTRIVAWNEATQTAYFIGTAEGKPAQRQLYKVSTATVGAVVSCVTCGTVNTDGLECTSNSASFSSGSTYYVHGCNGPNIPRSVIRQTSDNREVFVATENQILRDRLSQKAMPRPLNMQVPLGNNYFAQVRLILPPTLNAANKASSFPMLVYVYGGPHSQQVSDSFRIDWGTHLATSRGVIYALIDGRGSGYQGDKMMHEIYRRMGTVEIEDQIIVAKYLKDNLPFVDGNRTAIWGWSYGGFATASVLAADSANVFKCGMSVAPVTNWIYYDSIYTERYMGLPTANDNLKAYEDSDICKKAENFRGKQFYLIHGTGDDNVHYQQSLMLARSLEAKDVLFRQQSYTDENHSIGNLRTHLYHSLGTFLMTECFGLENEVWG